MPGLKLESPKRDINERGFAAPDIEQSERQPRAQKGNLSAEQDPVKCNQSEAAEHQQKHHLRQSSTALEMLCEYQKSMDFNHWILNGNPIIFILIKGIEKQWISIKNFDKKDSHFSIIKMSRICNRTCFEHLSVFRQNKHLNQPRKSQFAEIEKGRDQPPNLRINHITQSARMLVMPRQREREREMGWPGIYCKSAMDQSTNTRGWWSQIVLRMWWSPRWTATLWPRVSVIWTTPLDLPWCGWLLLLKMCWNVFVVSWEWTWNDASPVPPRREPPFF